MARIRSIKPEFWTDSLMVQMPPLVRLLYIGMWTAADDHGFIPDEPDRLCMEIMPREDPASIEAMIDLLIACGRLSRNVAEDGTSYLEVERWSKHQRVDKPSRSKLFREGSRKLAIRAEDRRKVARKYGCEPGESKDASCYFCGNPGSIWWPKLHSGKAGGWVAFGGLELDHFQPEEYGGPTEADNIVLSCRACNRSRGSKDAHIFVAEKLANSNTPREPSRGLLVGKEQGTWNREQGSSEPNGSDAAAPEVVVSFDARKALFDEAMPLLANYTGKPEAATRRLVGKWLQTNKDDALELNRLIATAVQDRKADPIAWIEGSLRPKTNWRNEDIWAGVL